MSHHEAQKIKRKLAPFMSLLLAVACMGLLASCGGGGADSYTSAANLPIANTQETIPFDQTKLNSSSLGKSLDDVDGYITNQYWVRSYSLSQQELLDKIKQLPNIKLLAKHPSVDGILIESNNEEDINQLRSTSGVDEISHRDFTGKNVNKKYEFSLPNDGSDFFDGGDNWHLEDAKIVKAWAVTEGASEIKIGIIDVGVNDKHSELDGRVERLLGYLSCNVLDDNSCVHGTAVAGAMVGKSNNEYGITGINFNSKAYLGDAVFDGVDEFDKRTKTFANYASLISLKNDIKVINNSWGFATNFLSKEQAILKTREARYIAAKTSNILHVWAGGNDGVDAIGQNGAIHLKSTGEYAPMKNVIIVGAYLKDGTLARYSVFGDTVDIVAPTAYKAARSRTQNSGDTYYFAESGDKYGSNDKDASGDHFVGFDGTSASAPVVTGVASLIASVNSKLTAEEIKEIIISSAIEGGRYVEHQKLIDGTLKKLPRKIPILNAELAVKKALDTLTKPTVTLAVKPSTTPQLGQSVEFTATASSANGAIKTYSWSFGDGTTLTGQTSPTTTHAYSATGDYAVMVTVTDEKGASATSSAVHIIPTAPNPTPTVTGISSPLAKAGVNSQFVISGTNLPTNEDLAVNVYSSDIGCSSFGYDSVNRTSTQHNFACTPTAGGTLRLSVSTAGGTSLGIWTVTVSSATTATVFNDDFNTLDTATWAYTPGSGSTGSWTGYAIENGQFKFGDGVLSTEGKKTFSGSKITLEFMVNYPSASAYRDLRVFLIKADNSKSYGVRDSLFAGTKQMFISDTGATTTPYTYTETLNQISFSFTLDNSGITLSAKGGTLNYGVSKGFTDGRNIAGSYYLRILGDGLNYIEAIKVTTE